MKENEPLITAVVTFFNRTASHRLVLEGFLRQIFKRFRLIVVSDGGKNYKDLILPYTKSLDIQYYYLYKQKKSFRNGTAKNIGIYHSVGKQIVFSDGDCVPMPQMLRNAYRYWDKPVIAAGIRYRVGERKAEDIENFSEIKRHVSSGDDRFLKNPEWRKKRLPRIRRMQSPGAIFPDYCHGFLVSYPVEVLKTIGGFSRDFENIRSQDAELAIRVCKSGPYTTILDKRISCYHLDHKVFSYSISEEHFKVKQKLLEEVRADNNPIRNKGSLVWYPYKRII